MLKAAMFDIDGTLLPPAISTRARQEALLTSVIR